jgi:hypothetical protein
MIWIFPMLIGFFIGIVYGRYTATEDMKEIIGYRKPDSSE